METPMFNKPRKYRYIIAIDPDVEESGYALLDTERDEILVAKKPFSDVLETFLEIADEERIGLIDPHYFVVVVEASWLLRSNWHLNKLDSKQRSAAKGYAVGRNHEVGRKICEMARYFGIDVVEHLPLRKCWKGKDRKITQEEISQFIPNFPKKTNQDERDAALLAWSFANKPIRVRAKT